MLTFALVKRLLKYSLNVITLRSTSFSNNKTPISTNYPTTKIMSVLRTSSYTITVPLDKEQCLLMHGYSGAMDVVDSYIAKALTNSEHMLTDELVNTDICQQLQKRAYLTTKNEEEERQYVARLANALHKKDQLLHASFTVLITYDCNFRCPYCFEKNDAVEKLHSRVMKRETVDCMYKCIDEIMKEKRIKSTNIMLYGGEPLLEENVEIVNYIVTEGVKRGYTFSAITNGYDLNYFTNLLSEDKIKDIQVTIDGMEAMHNSKRVHRDGVPTFKKIINNIGIVLDKGVRVTIRYNTDKTNFNQLIELKKYFESIGYTQYEKFSIDSARLAEYEAKLDTSKLYSQKEFIAEHEKMDTGNICHDYNMSARIRSAIRHKKPLPYSAVFCSSQFGNYIFDPMGKVYPCLEVVGKPQYQIGEYLTGSVKWYKEEREKWQRSNVMSFPTCRKCKYALLCGGGCYAHNIVSHRCAQMGEIIKYAVRKAYGEINNFKKEQEVEET